MVEINIAKKKNTVVVHDESESLIVSLDGSDIKAKILIPN